MSRRPMARHIRAAETFGRKIASGELEPWAAGIRSLAAEPNVACKLSGLQTIASPDWTYAELAPYIDVALEAFGPGRLIFGSDWPVAPMDPIIGIYAAVTRRTLDGRNPGGWIPEQKISVAQAVHAYTVGSAYAQFDEKIKGSLEPGKLADLVVLSRDIFHIDPIDIQNTAVDLTICDGRVVYEAPSPGR